MRELVPVFLFLAVGALSLFSFISVAVWSDARRRERETYYRTEMIKKVAEAQGAGTAAALEILREHERIAQRQQRAATRLGGLVTTAVGLGLMIFLRLLVRDTPQVYLAGLIPLLVGIALLAYSYALAPKG